MAIELVYVYGTGQREDGMRFAVSVLDDEGTVRAETVALFKDATDAANFAKVKADSLAVRFSILPSAAEARNANVWGTPRELIDSDEFCPECEREVPFHYSNCPLHR